MKRLLMVLFLILLLTSLFGCSQNNKHKSSLEKETLQPIETSNLEDVIDVYEAIFLDNEEVLNLFKKVRGEVSPLENVATSFHVTTEFKPEEPKCKWYGQKVNVHFIKYKIAEVIMDDGNITENEGFKVELSSDDEEFNKFLKSLNKNFHVTGTYKDAAKWTNNIDFSDGEDVDFTLEGIFGGYYSDNSIRFEGTNE